MRMREGGLPTVSAPPGAPAALGRELRSTARGGVLSLGGSLFGTAMGFVLVLVLARQLGAAGSGIVLQAVAVFMMALGLARFGMDTAAVWLLPRLRAEAPERVRGTCVALVAWPAAVAAAAPLAWWGGGPLLRPSGEGGGDALAGALDAVVWALPLGAVTMVALAATRAFGGVLPYTLVGNVALPLSRPAAVLVVTSLGGASAAASAAWAVPLVLAVLAALGVLAHRVRAFEGAAGVRGPWLLDRPTHRRLLGFSLPRTLSSGLEGSVVWLSIILVGALAGPAAAGVYGAATRFVSAGTALLHALRIVVAPRFSAQLGDGRADEAQGLYQVTTGWILLLGAPVYVVLAVFAPTVLGLLGPGFESGTTVLVVLCVGGLGLLLGGNVQSLLLMSGRSGWGAVDKAVVFTWNVAGILLLVPRCGPEGAALVWASGMWVDTALALVQVRRFTGIAPGLRSLGRCLAAVAACALLPAGAAAYLLGNSVATMVLALGLVASLMAGYVVLDRRHLHAAELRALLPRRRPGT